MRENAACGYWVVQGGRGGKRNGWQYKHTHTHRHTHRYCMALHCSMMMTLMAMIMMLMLMLNFVAVDNTPRFFATLFYVSRQFSNISFCFHSLFFVNIYIYSCNQAGSISQQPEKPVKKSRQPTTKTTKISNVNKQKVLNISRLKQSNCFRAAKANSNNNYTCF